MKKIFIVLFFIIIFSNLVKISAEEKLVFDSTDHYLGACQLTDKSEWELKEDLNVTKFEVWYNWNAGETTLPVTVYKDGEKFAEFVAERTSCDTYQKQWCNADFMINKLFPKGSYKTEIPNSRQCLKPGGTGAIRLYIDESIKKEEPTPTEKIIVQKETNEIKPTTIIPTKETIRCSCSQTTIVVTAVISSVITSFLVSILMRR